MTRRGLLSRMLVVLGLGALAAAQHDAAVQGGKAVVCDGAKIKCPLGHETCREIDAPLVVANDNRDYPDWARLLNYRMLRCNTCGILFAEKQY